MTERSNVDLVLCKVRGGGGGGTYRISSIVAGKVGFTPVRNTNNKE